MWFVVRGGRREASAVRQKGVEYLKSDVNRGGGGGCRVEETDALRCVGWNGVESGWATTDNGGVTGTKAWWGPTFDDPFPFSFLHHADLSKQLRNSGMREHPERKSRFGAGFLEPVGWSNRLLTFFANEI